MSRQMTASAQPARMSAFFGLARAVLGVAFLCRAVASRNGAGPGGAGRHGAGRDERKLSPDVDAVLGLRHLAQAAVSVRPTSDVLVLGAAADAAHAASMLAAALLPRPWRRAAALDGLLAGSMAAAGLALACDGEGARPEPVSGGPSWLRWRNRCATRIARSLVRGWPRSAR